MTDQPSFQFDEGKEVPFPTFEKTIGLCPTGSVQVTALEQKIIDHPDFQRLRRIRQLGAANLVYPTSVHTRFDHSIGVMAMADRMVLAICETDAELCKKEPNRPRLVITTAQRVLCRLYGLLHDITHIPFGHTIEDEMGLLIRHDENAERLDHFLGPSSGIGTLIRNSPDLQQGGYDRFYAIYTKGAEEALQHHDELLHHIVSNTICADLLDYLQRDSFFCHLGLDVQLRLLNFLHAADISRPNDTTHASNVRRPYIRLWKSKSGRPRLDTVTDLVRLLEARYMLAERVYFHHAKIAASTMISRAAQEALLENTLTEQQLWSMGDDGMVDQLSHTPHPHLSQSLARAFRERKLYKSTRKSYLERELTPDFPSAETKLRALRTDPDYRRKVEDLLAWYVRANLDENSTAGGVLIYAPSDTGGNGKIAKVHVDWADRIEILEDIKDNKLKRRLDVVREAHADLARIQIFVHSSLDNEETRDLTDKLFRAYVLSDELRHAEEACSSVVRHHLGKAPAQEWTRSEEDRLLAIALNYFQDKKSVPERTSFVDLIGATTAS